MSQICSKDQKSGDIIGLDVKRKYSLVHTFKF